MPATLVQAEEQDADDDPAVCLALGAFLEWGVATASGAVPEGWHCPPQAQRESWLPASRLTVQHGSFVRQGEWLAEPDRLALQFPILPDLPADLPTARRAWLEELLLDAQDRWHPVRLGITGDERRQTVVARVDLTGAPSCPFLFLTSLEALQYVTAWMVESAELLANMQVACAALALPPKKTQRRKEQDA